MPIPITTVFQGMFFLRSLNKNATIIIKVMPNMPLKISKVIL